MLTFFNVCTVIANTSERRKGVEAFDLAIEATCSRTMTF